MKPLSLKKGPRCYVKSLTAQDMHQSVSDYHVPEGFSVDHSAMPVGVVNETAEAVVWLPLTTD